MQCWFSSEFKNNAKFLKPVRSSSCYHGSIDCGETISSDESITSNAAEPSNNRVNLPITNWFILYRSTGSLYWSKSNAIKHKKTHHDWGFADSQLKTWKQTLLQRSAVIVSGSVYAVNTRMSILWSHANRHHPHEPGLCHRLRQLYLSVSKCVCPIKWHFNTNSFGRTGSNNRDVNMDSLSEALDSKTSTKQNHTWWKTTRGGRHRIRLHSLNSVCAEHRSVAASLMIILTSVFELKIIQRKTTGSHGTSWAPK